MVFSLQRVSFTQPNTFVGIDNYRQLFQSPQFMQSLRVTTIFAIEFLILSTVLGLAFAQLLNQRFIGRGIGRTLLIIPWAIPWLMVGIVWQWFLDGQIGALNTLLTSFGLLDSPRPFLSDPGLALHFTVLAAVWRQASLSGLLFLAALQTIPKDIEEAARVDGAGPFQRFRHVTVAWLKPVIGVVVVLNTVFALLQFDVVFAMTQGGPGDATLLLSILLYRELFVFTDAGAGAAIAVLLGLAALLTAIMFARLIGAQRPVDE